MVFVLTSMMVLMVTATSAVTREQDKNPCPTVFALDYPPMPDMGISGVIQVKLPRIDEPKLHIKGQFVTNSMTNIDTFSLSPLLGKSELEKAVRRGDPVYYRVSTGPVRVTQEFEDDDLLSVKQIEVNGRRICYRQRPIRGSEKSVTLEHDVTFTEPTIPCGVTARETNIELVSGGTTPDRDSWPWLVALYSKTLGSLTFICGGSLVSTKLVVTAAHCVTNKNTKAIVPRQTLVLRIGVYNIDDWTDDSSVTRTVTDIKLNNYFKDGQFIHDIALLTLSSPVKFTEVIRPVCLWEGDTDQDQIVGKTGTVVGWGRDEYGFKVTIQPQMIIVPIVSVITCRGTDQRFHAITFNTTFCAGERNGSGPCSGDSGGGMYMKVGNKWTLRGVVSNALKNLDGQCDLDNYVVYTDSAMYVPWIKESMQPQN